MDGPSWSHASLLSDFRGRSRLYVWDALAVWELDEESLLFEGDDVRDAATLLIAV